MCGAAAASLLGACAYAERSPEPAPSSVAGDEALFIAGSLEQVATGFIFTEGPAWDGGQIIFSDIPGDTVYTLSVGGDVSVLYTPSWLANGHTFDREGRLLSAEHASGAITRWTPENGREIIVDQFEGKHLNSPNDVVVRQADGMLFFTDPPYGLGNEYKGQTREREVTFNGVFAFDEATGDMGVIDDSLSRPNGIALSLDESRLYVSDAADNKLWVYDLAEDGSAKGKRLLADLSIPDGEYPVDGMRIDTEGRIFATCPEGICVLSPAGDRIATLDLPVRATNVSFGGPNLADLYITAGSDVWRVSTGARGTGSSVLP
jgi:gluconolactonase